VRIEKIHELHKETRRIVAHGDLWDMERLRWLLYHPIARGVDVIFFPLISDRVSSFLTALQKEEF